MTHHNPRIRGCSLWTHWLVTTWVLGQCLAFSKSLIYVAWNDSWKKKIQNKTSRPDGKRDREREERISNKNSINQHPQRLWRFGGYFQGLSILEFLSRKIRTSCFFSISPTFMVILKLCSFPLWLQDRHYLGSFAKQDSFWPRVSSPVSSGTSYSPHDLESCVFRQERSRICVNVGRESYGKTLCQKRKCTWALVYWMSLCAQSHLTLCDPRDCSHQASLSIGFFRQEY